MRASHKLDHVSVSFDERNLVPNAGLLAPALIAQKLGVGELIDERVDLGGRPGAANGGAKALTVVGAALAGGDSIDGVDVLRSGAAPRLFDDIRAPSTVGTWLRSFTWASVRMLDAVLRVVLMRAWAAGFGPERLDAPLTLDVDSTLCETYGLAKQGATKFTYQHSRGYHPLLAALAETGELIHVRLRGGNANSGRGAASLLAEAIGRIRAAGHTGELLVRADAGFYAAAFVAACRRAGARFSVTARMNPAIRAAIEAIPEHAWRPIPYWLDGGADVAETRYTAFTSTNQPVTCRLVVRRVRPTPGSQLALDVVFDYHAFITDRQGPLLEIEADHRAHAIVEHVIADLKHHAGLAHLPSGRFAANAAWLALIGLAYNLARWTARAAGSGWARITTATLRRCLLVMPARLVHSARRLHLRAPQNWPWAEPILRLLDRLRALPAV
jgi:Transposase DDE domain group 1